MKRLLVVFILVAGLAAVAFASFNNRNKTVHKEKKAEKPKKQCGHTCLFS